MTREDLFILKDVAQRADAERPVVFQAVVRLAIDVLGLIPLAKATDLGTGLLARRYATGYAQPALFMRRAAFKEVVAMVDERLATDDYSERTDEDRAEEAKRLETYETVGWTGVHINKVDPAKAVPVRAMADELWAASKAKLAERFNPVYADLERGVVTEDWIPADGTQRMVRPLRTTVFHEHQVDEPALPSLADLNLSPAAYDKVVEEAHVRAQ